LFDNEIAVDVGSQCLGHDGCDALVLDHHFERPGNFPAAAAAVLHLAGGLVEVTQLRTRGRAGREVAPPPIWLVTHDQPDFDAFCAMYLARCVLTGTCPSAGWDERGVHPHGWDAGERGVLDWFRPRVGEWPEEYRWPALLASYAAHVDQCRPLKVPRARALHAVLYAALHRDRPLLPEGAFGLFEAARRAMTGGAPKNPLVDSLFGGHPDFAPELELLAEEECRYERDVSRARKALVTLRSEPFADEAFQQTRATPLHRPDGQIDPAHLRTAVERVVQVDGLYLRDPESLLFKEWARGDVRQSLGGRGFVFTAVAYSCAKGATCSGTDYYFALDPERAGNTHLYNVWARLQHAEWVARGRPDPDGDRNDMRGRQVGLDPWYDGNAYRGTIVVTPRAGTGIPAGVASDLGDDPVAEIVRRELEDTVFASRVVTWDDFHLAGGQGGTVRGGCDIDDLAGVDVASESFRVAWIPLAEGTDLRRAGLAEQIGRRLWPVLHPAAVAHEPADFAERHLVAAHDHVGVWNRRGIAIAWQPGADAQLEFVRANVGRLAESLRVMKAIAVQQGSSPGRPATDHPSTRRLLEDLVRVKQAAATAEGRVLRRLLDALGFEEQVALSVGLLRQEHQAAERKRDLDLQKVFGVSAGLGVLLGGLQVFGWNPSTLMPWPVAGGLLATAAAVPIAIVLWRSKAS
jgi:hypothetical protein